MADARSKVLIVHPGSDGESHRALAYRLFAALGEGSWEVTLFSSRELCETTTYPLSDALLAVVDPIGCAAASNDRLEFFAKLAAASRRIAISTEAVEDARYGQQFRLPVDFDAVFDVGFVPQSDKHTVSDVPYYFVFNGPTKREEQVISESPSSQERHIPWTVVGHQNPEHLSLVAELIDYKLYPGGFVFLQSSSRMRKGGAPLSPSELAAVLSKTNYYLWCSRHSSAYYESLHFVEALLAGAVPCKIDGGCFREIYEIPGIFPSVQSFCERVREEGAWPSMYRSAREFYLSRGRLAEYLEEALHLV